MSQRWAAMLDDRRPCPWCGCIFQHWRTFVSHRLPGPAGEATSTLRPVTVAEVCAEQRLDALLERLLGALRQQAEGNAPKRAAAARERAARLAALVALAR